jgi:hypothetical protein
MELIKKHYSGQVDAKTSWGGDEKTVPHHQAGQACGQ